MLFIIPAHGTHAPPDGQGFHLFGRTPALMPDFGGWVEENLISGPVASQAVVHLFVIHKEPIIQRADLLDEIPANDKKGPHHLVYFTRFPVIEVPHPIRGKGIEPRKQAVKARSFNQLARQCGKTSAAGLNAIFGIENLGTQYPDSGLRFHAPVNDVHTARQEFDIAVDQNVIAPFAHGEKAFVCTGETQVGFVAAKHHLGIFAHHHLHRAVAAVVVCHEHLITVLTGVLANGGQTSVQQFAGIPIHNGKGKNVLVQSSVNPE